MAATGQAAAGGEGQAAQGQGGEAAQNGQQQAQGPDLGQLAEQIGALGGGLDEMKQFLQSNPWQQQQDQGQGQQQDEGLDLSFLDPGQQMLGDDPAALSAQLGEVIKGAVQQQAQALMAPHVEAQNEMRRNIEARDLAGEFPELSTPEMANKIAGQGGVAEQIAQQIANAVGQPQLAKALAAEPALWRMAYGYHKGIEYANNQGSGDPGAAHLEGGGGPGPAQLSEADLVKQIATSGDGLGAGVLNGI